MSSISPPLPDVGLAGRLGELVNDCYDLYDAYPNELHPPVGTNITKDYIVVAYITMVDYFLQSTERVFYGLVLSKANTLNQFVVAIRGTSNWYEAWDDWRSMSLTSYSWGPGLVGEGFLNVYATMDPSPNLPVGAGAAPPPPQAGAADFATALHKACESFLIKREKESPHGLSMSDATYVIAGHSLGSALATLLASQLASHKFGRSTFLCTFASPIVGDATFAGWFDRIGQIKCWRIANDLDSVTYVPQDIDGDFTHVNSLYSFSSVDVCPGLICYHSILTYLHYVDSKYALRSQCVLTWDCEFAMRTTRAPDFSPPRAPEQRS